MPNQLKIPFMNSFMEINVGVNLYKDCGCKNPTDSSNSPSTHDQCPQTIQDTINHLHFDYEDCHPQYWDNWSAECQGHYRSCINQNNAIDCGIPLLNISISVRTAEVDLNLTKHKPLFFIINESYQEKLWTYMPRIVRY